MKIKPKDEERFFSKVDSTEAEACHRWTACTTLDGYGLFYIDGGLTTAHRVSYGISNGPIPEGMVVRHCNQCTTRGCVNPDHLSVGTQADNMRDRDLAGRTPRGESSGVSKLKEADVKEIRLLAAQGETRASTAEAYNVSSATISAIVKRKTWKHIP